MAGVTKITCFGVHGLSGDGQQASTLSDNSRNPGSCDSWPRSIVEALSNRLWTSPGYRSSQVWWEAVNPHGVDRKEPQPCGISSHPEITSSTRQLIGVIAGFLKNSPSSRTSTVHLQQARAVRDVHRSALRAPLRQASSGPAPVLPDGVCSPAYKGT